MLEYVVKLGWRVEFTFDDGLNALTFAQMAAEGRVEEECDGEIVITIRRKMEEVKEESEDV